MSLLKESTTAERPIPVPVTQPLPHRKVMRRWLIPLSRRTTAYAILLLIFDYTLLLGALAGTVLITGWLGKIACGVAAGFMIGRLFIIGHDACHQSLTPHRRLNRVLGRIAFLPSITPYSLWDVGHNVVHHGYTNLKGFDFVWAPLTRDEFNALPLWRQALDRIYRSGWAPGLYYMIEIWWLRMFFPSQAYMGTRRSIFLWDCLLVSASGLVWIASLIAASPSTAPATAGARGDAANRRPLSGHPPLRSPAVPMSIIVAAQPGHSVTPAGDTAVPPARDAPRMSLVPATAKTAPRRDDRPGAVP